jgi:hypothetical protein
MKLGDEEAGDFGLCEFIRLVLSVFSTVLFFFFFFFFSFAKVKKFRGKEDYAWLRNVFFTILNRIVSV